MCITKACPPPQHYTDSLVRLSSSTTVSVTSRHAYPILRSGRSEGRQNASQHSEIITLSPVTHTLSSVRTYCHPLPYKHCRANPPVQPVLVNSRRLLTKRDSGHAIRDTEINSTCYQTFNEKLRESQPGEIEVLLLVLFFCCLFSYSKWVKEEPSQHKRVQFCFSLAACQHFNMQPFSSKTASKRPPTRQDQDTDGESYLLAAEPSRAFNR